MKKANTTPQLVVDRLERKFQRKIRFQKYKSLTRHLWKPSSLRGISTEDFQNPDDESWDLYTFNEYEPIGR